MSTTEEKIAKMYEAQLKSQKEQIGTDYDQAVSDLDAQQQKNQQITDANLNRTAVEAQKAAVNNAELHNAYGLSSGTRAQARLAQENQLQADMTALRAAQQNADADTERQRSLLAKEYASAIRQAQAENDLAKAQALYAAAEEEEERLLAKQEAAAKLMADAGDYSRLGTLYGLSKNEIAALSGDTIIEGGLVDEDIPTDDDSLSQTRRDEIYGWLEGYLTNKYLPAGFDPNRLIKGSSFLASDAEREYAREIVRYLSTLR